MIKSSALICVNCCLFNSVYSVSALTIEFILAIIFAKIFCKMLQLQVLRQDPQAVKERLAVKNFNQIDLVDEIICPG